MPVELLVARPATGKTYHCIQKIQHVLSLTPLSTVWVIVPDRLQAAAFRNRLAQSGGAMGAYVGTFGDLYRNILEHSGGNVPIASSPLLHFIIQDVVHQAHARGELAYYASLRTMPGFFLALRDVFAELKRSLVFPENFINCAKTGTPGQRELAGLYFLYQSRLRELGWADPEGLSWLAVEALESSHDAANSISLLVVDGFDSLTGAQRRAMELLADRVGEMLVTFPGATNSSRLVHRRFGDTLEKMMQGLSPTITTLSETLYLPSDVLYLENSLFEPKETAVRLPQAPLLLEARSPADEAREALRWIKARIIRDEITLSDCAIFTPDPQVYDPFLRACAQEFGIPVHFSHAMTLTSSPVITALLSLIALPVQNFRSRILFNVLRSPYFETGLETGSIDSLETISRKAKIIEGQDQWKETWERLNLVSPEQPDLDDERRLPGLPRGDQANALRQSLQAFFDLFVLPARTLSQTAWVSWLEDLLDRLKLYYRADQENDEVACESLREVLRAIVLSETVIGEKYSNYEGFVSSLQNALNGASLPEPRLKGRPTLIIGEMMEARGVRFKAVALLGFSEGVFPHVERADPFLDESLRMTVGLDSRLDREQAGLFYQAITRTDQYLLITRPYLSASGEDWEASPYWKEVQKRFTKSVLRVVRPDDIPDLNEAASSHELLFWAVRQRVLPKRFEEFAPRWKNLQYAREILSARRAKQPVGVYEGFSPDLSQVLADRYPFGSIWSASRLEAYGNCPHQFYIKVALELEEKTVPELGWEVWQLGSMLHKFLEQSYSNAIDPNDVASVLTALSDIAQPIFEDAPSEYGFRPSSLWEYQKAELFSMLRKTIEALQAQSNGWEPVAYEKKFGIDRIPPLQIDLGSETMKLRGVIDRLDRNEQGNIRVVDYKSGSSHLEPKDLVNGARLQLPLYALAARETLQLGNVTEGIYWKIKDAKPSSLKLSNFKTDNGTGVEEAIHVVLEHLKQILSGIRAGEFPPIPPKGGCASYCIAKQWCWRYQPGWRGGK